MFDWGDLRFVLAVSRERTLVGAARRLGVNQTTVGRRISALEDALGARLFDRVEQRLVPTAAGSAAIRRAQSIEREALGTVTEIAGVDQSLSGPVRLTSVSLITTNVLAPRLHELLTQYPNIDLELVDSPRNLDLQHKEADIALRGARPTIPSAVVRRVGNINFQPYVSRRYVARATELPWVVFSASMDDLPESRWLAEQTKDTSPLVRVSDIDTMIQVVQTMPCRAILPTIRVGPESNLVLLNSGEPVVTREVWLVYLEAMRSNARVTVVGQWAARVCADTLV